MMRFLIGNVGDQICFARLTDRKCAVAVCHAKVLWPLFLKFLEELVLRFFTSSAIEIILESPERMWIWSSVPPTWRGSHCKFFDVPVK